MRNRSPTQSVLSAPPALLKSPIIGPGIKAFGILVFIYFSLALYTKTSIAEMRYKQVKSQTFVQTCQMFE